MSSQKYLCIQRSETGECPPPSPDQMQAMYASFQAWMEKYQQNIVDMGGKLGDGSVVSSKGSTDGPYIEAKEVIGGYMIITAESLEEAIKIAQESPGTGMPGSSVEVREIQTE
ncbi:MAG: YciI family protein [Verrucomicrobiia bacterium]